MHTLIRNGTIVTADEIMLADVRIEGETIREVRAGIPAEGMDRVIDAARRLPGGDREVKVLAWAGYRYALRGEAESARQHLRSFAPSDPFSRFVCSVASTLTVDRFDEARAQLEEVARAVPPGTLAIKVYRGAVREIARRFGASRWWRIAQWFRV